MIPLSKARSTHLNTDSKCIKWGYGISEMCRVERLSESDIKIWLNYRKFEKKNEKMKKKKRKTQTQRFPSSRLQFSYATAATAGIY